MNQHGGGFKMAEIDLVPCSLIFYFVQENFLFIKIIRYKSFNLVN